MAEKRKILYVVEAFGGGVFTYIVDLANRLADTFDIYIAFSIRKQTPNDFEKYFNKRIHLIEVKNFGRAIDPISDVKAFFELKNIAKNIDPDVIHLHSSKAGALGRFAFDGKKVSLFYTPHGYSFLMKNQSIPKRLLYKAIEWISARRTCTTISCGEGEHKETLKLTKRAVYVNNGVNIEDLNKLIESIEIENTQFSVFTLGRICYQKNPKLFNKVAEMLPDVKFVWIGDGELRNELTSPNIEITGWVDRKTALECSMRGSVFVLTSLWEGLPISLLEAMYMKKLCVVSDVIGNHDVIESGENGYVCDSEKSFVGAIKTALNCDVSNILNHAANDVETIYNTKTMAEKYSKIYRS